MRVFLIAAVMAVFATSVAAKDIDMQTKCWNGARSTVKKIRSNRMPTALHPAACQCLLLTAAKEIQNYIYDWDNSKGSRAFARAERFAVVYGAICKK